MSVNIKTQWYKNFGMQQEKFQREVYSNTDLHQEESKTSNKKYKLTPKGTRKITTNKNQTDQKKGENKVQNISK